MALASKKHAVAESEIPPISADPEFAAAAALLGALDAKSQALGELIQILELERYLEPRPVNRTSPTDTEQRARLRWLKTKVAVAEAMKPVATGAGRPEIAAAIRLLEGDDVPPPATMATRLATARRQLSVVDRAIAAQAEIVAQIRERKCAELSQRLAEHVDALVVRAYRSAQQLIRDTAAVRDVNAAVVKAGYGQLRSDIAPTPVLRGAALLGLETDWSSDISTMRRALEQRGIL